MSGGWKDRWVVCYDCQKTELSKPIKGEKFKKMFDIPEEFYKENTFLRSIKLNYIKYGELSAKQIEVFKKVVKDVKAEKKKEEKEKKEAK
jgi:CRISPR/Cas system-associated protein endoribonuclease Cas2